MWMMGCNDGGEIFFPTHNDSFSSGRKHRLLIPKPPPNPSTNASSHNHHHHHHGRGARDPEHHGLFALNHPHPHRATMAGQSNRDFNATHQVVVCSRWNPTPEQLRALEEMYRRGTRTPSADQIQQITSQLRCYGTIEGKNVFYWFQNHKARERQKRRRQMESCIRAEEEKGHLNNHRETGNRQRKESGGASCKAASDDFQRDNNNSYNWESADGSIIDKGERSSMVGGSSASAASSATAVKATSTSLASSTADGSIIDKGERSSMVGGSSASAASSATAVKATSTSLASSTADETSLWSKLNDTRELLLPNSNLIITDNSMNHYDNFRRSATCSRLLPAHGPAVLPISTTAGGTILTALRSSSPSPLPFPSQDFQTLQLFPLRSEKCEEDRVCYVEGDNHLGWQFFEFLPMKK